MQPIWPQLLHVSGTHRPCSLQTVPSQQVLTALHDSPQQAGGIHPPLQSRKFTLHPLEPQVPQIPGTHRPSALQTVPSQHGRSSPQVSPQQMGKSPATGAWATALPATKQVNASDRHTSSIRYIFNSPSSLVRPAARALVLRAARTPDVTFLTEMHFSLSNLPTLPRAGRTGIASAQRSKPLSCP